VRVCVCVCVWVRVCVCEKMYLQRNVVIKNQLDALISKIYFCNKTLHVSDCSSVHHQDFFTVHTAMAYVVQVC